MNHLVTLVAAALSASATSLACAQDAAPAPAPAPAPASEVAPAPAATDVHALVGGLLTFGGDKLGTLYYSDGTSQSINTGGLVDLHGGIEVRPMGGPLSVQATVGYHVDRVGARNGDATFSRVPFELLGLVDVAPRFRAGLGWRHATSVSLRSSGAASGVGSQDFSDADGVIVQAEFRLRPRVAIVARWVHERYGYNYTYVDASDHVVSGRASFDGSHGGIGVDWTFF